MDVLRRPTAFPLQGARQCQGPARVCVAHPQPSPLHCTSSCCRPRLAPTSRRLSQACFKSPVFVAHFQRADGASKDAAASSILIWIEEKTELKKGGRLLRETNVDSSNSPRLESGDALHPPPACSASQPSAGSLVRLAKSPLRPNQTAASQLLNRRWVKPLLQVAFFLAGLCPTLAVLLRKSRPPRARAAAAGAA